ncbi:hypothetical protein MNBD_IGNAVI01-1892 [hydrothermal vent metagenome]|uniref:OmpA-like domain-containing protein n=1 Tax=hydrothermal vent metagenome TaxID=652676 RepID=A0A3B1BLM7_9ZZZZ
MEFFNKVTRKLNHSKFIAITIMFFITSIITQAQVSKDAWIFGFGASMPKVSMSWDNIGGYLSIQRNFTEHTGLRLTGNYNNLTRGFGPDDIYITKTIAFWGSLDMVYYFSPCNSFSPFAVVSLGLNYFTHDNPQQEPKPNESDVVMQVGAGVGIEIYLSEDWKLKPEIDFYTPATDYYDGRYGSNGGGIFGTSYDAVVKGDLGIQWYFSRGERSNICQLYDGIERKDNFDYNKVEKMLDNNIPKEIVTEKVVIKPAAKSNSEMLLMGVNFEFNSSRLTPESYPVLYHVAQRLKEFPELKIEIDGHCDSIGTVEVNQRISLERANVVKNYMVERGIDESRIKTVGYGFSRPIADNSTPEGRAMNRRIEFRIVK